MMRQYLLLGSRRLYTAMSLVECITQDTVEKTGGVEIRTYIVEQQRRFEESRG